MSLSLSHWYPVSGVVIFVSIPDPCILTYLEIITCDSSIYTMDYPLLTVSNSMENFIGT